MSCAHVHMSSSLVSNVESVHLQTPNMLDIDVSKLDVVKTQVMSWKQDMLGIFVINDGLLVDLVKLHMLWCIICKSK